VGSGIGVVVNIETRLGVGVAAPSLGSAGRVVGHFDRVDNDGKVEVVDGVASQSGVLI